MVWVVGFVSTTAESVRIPLPGGHGKVPLRELTHAELVKVTRAQEDFIVPQLVTLQSL
jgi:hypothetical protein